MSRQDVAAALAICDTCPIRARCARLADARWDYHRNGVLAGRKYFNGKIEHLEAMPA
jgi:hypothetical protein